MLEEFVDGAWVPLGFWSKTLKKEHAKWSTYRRELFSIHQSLRYFLDDINGRELVIWTDHRPLVGAFKGPNTMPHDPIAENQIQEISH